MDQGTIDKIRAYFKTKPVLRAWLFGSCARGEDRPDSDIDLLVDFDPEVKVSLLDHVGMMLDLQDRLTRKVDLLTSRGLMPFARKSVDQDKIMIYER